MFYLEIQPSQGLASVAQICMLCSTFPPNFTFHATSPVLWRRTCFLILLTVLCIVYIAIWWEWEHNRSVWNGQITHRYACYAKQRFGVVLRKWCCYRGVAERLRDLGDLVCSVCTINTSLFLRNAKLRGCGYMAYVYICKVHGLIEWARASAPNFTTILLCDRLCAGYLGLSFVGYFQFEDRITGYLWENNNYAITWASVRLHNKDSHTPQNVEALFRTHHGFASI